MPVRFALLKPSLKFYFEWTGICGSTLSLPNLQAAPPAPNPLFHQLHLQVLFYRHLTAKAGVAEAPGGFVVPMLWGRGIAVDPYAAGGAEASATAVEPAGVGSVGADALLQQGLPEVGAGCCLKARLLTIELGDGDFM